MHGQDCAARLAPAPTPRAGYGQRRPTSRASSSLNGSSRAISAASLKARPAWSRARHEGLSCVVQIISTRARRPPGPRPRAPELLRGGPRGHAPCNLDDEEQSARPRVRLSLKARPALGRRAPGGGCPAGRDAGAPAANPRAFASAERSRSRRSQWSTNWPASAAPASGLALKGAAPARLLVAVSGPRSRSARGRRARHAPCSSAINADGGGSTARAGFRHLRSLSVKGRSDNPRGIIRSGALWPSGTRASEVALPRDARERGSLEARALEIGSYFPLARGPGLWDCGLAAAPPAGLLAGLARCGDARRHCARNCGDDREAHSCRRASALADGRLAYRPLIAKMIPHNARFVAPAGVAARLRADLSTSRAELESVTQAERLRLWRRAWRRLSRRPRRRRASRHPTAPGLQRSARGARSADDGFWRAL